MGWICVGKHRVWGQDERDEETRPEAGNAQDRRQLEGRDENRVLERETTSAEEEVEKGEVTLTERVRRLAGGQVAVLVVGILVLAYHFNNSANEAFAESIGTCMPNAPMYSSPQCAKDQSDESSARLGAWALLVAAGYVSFVWFGRKNAKGADK
jgi:hypothetical protein